MTESNVRAALDRPDDSHSMTTVSSPQPEWRRTLRKRPAPLLTEPLAVNTTFVGHTDVDGRADAVQLQMQVVEDRGYINLSGYNDGIWTVNET